MTTRTCYGSIALEIENPTVTPGEEVAGTVVLTATKEVPKFAHVKVALTGVMHATAVVGFLGQQQTYREAHQRTAGAISPPCLQ